MASRRPPLIPPGVGAHVPNGHPLREAELRGADLVQIFLSNPQAWKKPLPRTDAAELARSPLPIIVHAPYLINVVAEPSRIRIPSRRILQESCDAAAEIGAAAVVVHGGHLVGEADLEEAFPRWRKALLELDTRVPVLIENTASGDKAVARRVDSIERLWSEIGDLGPGFVLDTCHAWAGGEPAEQLVERLSDITGGIDLVHCNDSRDGFDSRRDRHANLGRGEIPETVLASMLGGVHTVIVETPGNAEDHIADIDWVRRHMAHHQVA